MVRGIMHPFSRRQMINAKKMQARQEKLAPEVKKLRFGPDCENVRPAQKHGYPVARLRGEQLLPSAECPNTGLVR